MTRSLALFGLLAGGLALGACASSRGGESAPGEAATPSVRVFEVTAGSLNVRAEPSVSSAVVGSVKRGTQVRAPQGESDGWLYVEAPDGATGYVSSRYVRALAATPAQPAESAKPAAASGEPPARAPKPGTPLARIEMGMSEDQVLEILGEPTSRQNYTTGKQWIPFYYGPDTSRLDYKYEGVGRVVFGRNRYSSVTKVIRVDADPSEDGS